MYGIRESQEGKNLKLLNLTDMYSSLRTQIWDMLHIFYSAFTSLN